MQMLLIVIQACQIISDQAIFQELDALRAHLIWG